MEKQIRKEPRLTEAAVRNHEQLFPDHQSAIKDTDPELIELFDNFAFDEVITHDDLPVKTRLLVILSATIGAQALTEYRVMLGASLQAGLSPVEIKEILYQSVAYVGVAKALDFLQATNAFLTEKGVDLPLAGQSTTSPDNRMEKGLAVQKAIFGEAITEMYQKSPKDLLHIQRLLSANCFGDYYTRTGLDLPARELVTFSVLVGLGGTEAQIKGHIKGNAHVGNGRQLLIDVLTQLLPYVGYPRTLTAITCLNEVLPPDEQAHANNPK